MKINDVVGMDGDGCHILRVNDESLRRALQEHEGWLRESVVKDYLKHRPALLAEILDDPTLRNVIYTQERAAREAKQERRQRHRQAEIERQRRQEQHRASIATRKALDFYRDVLGIEE